jgi:hypothetical protein
VIPHSLHQIRCYADIQCAVSSACPLHVVIPAKAGTKNCFATLDRSFRIPAPRLNTSRAGSSGMTLRNPFHRRQIVQVLGCRMNLNLALMGINPAPTVRMGMFGCYAVFSSKTEAIRFAACLCDEAKS